MSWTICRSMPTHRATRSLGPRGCALSRSVFPSALSSAGNGPGADNLSLGEAGAWRPVSQPPPPPRCGIHNSTNPGAGMPLQQGQPGIIVSIRQDVFQWEKKRLECPVVSQICTLWPLRFHQEFFSLMQPICPDGYPPTAISYPPTAVAYPPRFLTKKKSGPLKKWPGIR